jgi:hypothetical protein
MQATDYARTAVVVFTMTICMREIVQAAVSGEV